MVLPEMHIRLEIDGEVVKQHHLTSPYRMRERNAVLSFLRSLADGIDYQTAYIVFAPVYNDDGEIKLRPSERVIRRSPSHTYNSRERRQQRLNFVIAYASIFAEMYDSWKLGPKRRHSVLSDERVVSLLLEARTHFQYRNKTSDMDIADALFNCYRQHLRDVALQEFAKGL